MCQSQADGGLRCAAHTRPRYEAATPGTAEWDEAAAEYASTPSGAADLEAQRQAAEQAGEIERAVALEHALARGARLRERAAEVREALTAASGVGAEVDSRADEGPTDEDLDTWAAATAEYAEYRDIKVAVASGDITRATALARAEAVSWLDEPADRRLVDRLTGRILDRAAVDGISDDDINEILEQGDYEADETLDLGDDGKVEVIRVTPTCWLAHFDVPVDGDRYREYSSRQEALADVHEFLDWAEFLQPQHEHYASEYDTAVAAEAEWLAERMDDPDQPLPDGGLPDSPWAVADRYADHVEQLVTIRAFVAGVSEEEARRQVGEQAALGDTWLGSGLSAEDAIWYCALGLDPEDARTASRFGARPETARDWLRAGAAPGEIAKWAGMGWDHSDVQLAARAGITPDEAQSEGWSPADADIRVRWEMLAALRGSGG